MSALLPPPQIKNISQDTADEIKNIDLTHMGWLTEIKIPDTRPYININIKKMDNMVTPLCGTSGSAGYDIYSSEECKIPPHERRMISTNLFIEIPKGFYGSIRPRSGLAVKHGIDVLAGVIDEDYRGEIKVVLYNSDKDKTFVVNNGDRIAQLIFQQYMRAVFTEVKDFSSETKRGCGGFGSTS